MTIPNPGSDDARAAGCECSPTDNGAVHPFAGQPAEKHHGKTERQQDGWKVNWECRMHTSDAWTEQEA